MAVAAHEVGHAAQMAEGSAWMQIRSLLVPAAMVGPQIAYLFIIGGLILNLAGLFTVGILLFGIAVLFSSRPCRWRSRPARRRFAMLKDTGIITSQKEHDGARSMLTAAALTYVAAAVTAILTMLYYITLARRG
jgi:Zn-dependent membrane protease YugP